jgi:hypothetical protein
MYNFAVLYLKESLNGTPLWEKLRKSYAVNLYVPPFDDVWRRQVAFINDVIITNAFSISRVMSEDSILLDIVQEKGNRFDYSIHNIFADSYNLCSWRIDKTERSCPFIKQPYRLFGIHLL